MSNFSNQQLMNAISFNEKDLALNRQFKLSERQRNWLKPLIDLNVAFSFFLTTGFFFFNVAAFFQGSESIFSFLLSLIGVIGFGLSFYWAFRSVQWVKELKDYTGVKFVEGQADFKIAYRKGGNFYIPTYSMKVGKIKLYLHEDVYDSINGSEFRVYYFQTFRKKILSIETLN